MDAYGNLWNHRENIGKPRGTLWRIVGNQKWTCISASAPASVIYYHFCDLHLYSGRIRRECRRPRNRTYAFSLFFFFSASELLSVCTNCGSTCVCICICICIGIYTTPFPPPSLLSADAGVTVVVVCLFFFLLSFSRLPLQPSSKRRRCCPMQPSSKRCRSCPMRLLARVWMLTDAPSSKIVDADRCVL